MAMSEVLQRLRGVSLLPHEADLTDAQLLECFVSRRETVALEALLRRHGLMVWGVCRRVLGNHHDAEDAFQATFLVFVRKAASIRSRAQVGNWLYGVAHQTALKARAARARRRERERPAAEMPEPAASEPNPGSDLQPLLDQEVRRLPEKQRTVLVLCELEGKTLREAARQLGCPEGTVASRLARARALLTRRLTRQGVMLSGGVLAGLLGRQVAPAAVPSAVLTATIRAMTRVAAGQAATTVLPARVAALMEGVLKSMFMTRLRTVLGICLAVALLLGGVFGYCAFPGGNAAPEAAGDRLADTLTLLDKQWWEATSRYDVDTLNKLLTEDYIAFNADGPRWTRAMTLDNYRKSRYTEVQFLTERAVFRIDEHTAIMSYQVRWRGEGKDGSGVSSGRNRLVHCWVQRDGGWFIKYTESVSLPELKPEVAPYLQLSPTNPFIRPATK